MGFCLDFIDVFDYARMVAKLKNRTLVFDYLIFPLIQLKLLNNFDSNWFLCWFFNTFIYNWVISCAYSFLKLINVIDWVVSEVFQMFEPFLLFKGTFK